MLLIAVNMTLLKMGILSFSEWVKENKYFRDDINAYFA